MLNRRGIQSVGQLLVHFIACGAVIVEHAHLDQAVGVERRVDLLLNAGCQTVATDHDHGVQVMRIGAVFPTLGRSELNLRHNPYYLNECVVCLSE
ncbi:hypothetical protein SDC9_142407 [bioreactor metagenome]|uniref:Uncharacterized protein n=1 Tax=bioreactor metagenome TaxID=1076179 RepID=A0A645E369_9ZZZZ